jgi:FkbM family methyltransferase
VSISEFVYTVVLKPPPLKWAANAVIRALLPATVRVGGATVHLNPSDPVISGALLFRVYERDELAFFKANFRPHMNLIDVGANVGLYTAIAASSPGFTGRILSIEPDQESFGYLLRTVASNGAKEVRARVKAVQAAAVERKGMLNLYKNVENRGDNRIYEDPMLGTGEAVMGDTLDNLCAQYGMTSANFIKIDVQGAEGRVLAGASRIIERSPECILMSEFWPEGLRRAGTRPEDYLAAITGLGFRLHELQRGTLVPVKNHLALANRYAGRRYTNIVGLKA